MKEAFVENTVIIIPSLLLTTLFVVFTSERDQLVLAQTSHVETDDFVFIKPGVMDIFNFLALPPASPAPNFPQYLAFPAS